MSPRKSQMRLKCIEEAVASDTPLAMVWIFCAIEQFAGLCMGNKLLLSMNNAGSSTQQPIDATQQCHATEPYMY